jgi:hypothetical protein
LEFALDERRSGDTPAGDLEQSRRSVEPGNISAAVGGQP